MVSVPVALDFVDLFEVPFTVPGSRFLVRRVGDVLQILHVRYETPLDECVAVSLRLGARAVGGVVTAGGHVRVGGVRIVILDEEVRLTWGSDTSSVVTGTAPGVERSQGEHRLLLLGAGSRPSALDDAGFARAADRVVEEWMGRVPATAARRQEMARQCWWVLGSNIIRMRNPLGGGLPRENVVVPSMRGYMALWQWDAYFIAVGLRHGDPELAVRQLEIAFTPGPDGQLPDVIHDGGVLTSSRDLPPGDLAALEASGSPELRGKVVPLTKPPLSAWAADKVLMALDADERLDRMAAWYPVLCASQAWWFRSENMRDGCPVYLHPYSSGLDDSPVFDKDLPVRTPDLPAYLAVQERVLARWRTTLESAGHPVESGVTVSPADDPVWREATVRSALERLWDPRRRMFAPAGASGRPLPRTILSLVACFAGGIGGEQIAAIVDDIHDTRRFGAPWPLPTVSMDEQVFREQTMWRGPVWVDTNYLVAEGLESCGRAHEAADLRRRTLDLVEAAGGPVEYASARSGARCPAATTSFGWSAALYIDLAVREAAEQQSVG